jgi:hypothetical protein
VARRTDDEAADEAAFRGRGSRETTYLLAQPSDSRLSAKCVHTSSRVWIGYASVYKKKTVWMVSCKWPCTWQDFTLHLAHVLLCRADEMGLGKTLQTYICSCSHARVQSCHRAALDCCPLRKVDAKAIGRVKSPRWAPTLKAVKFHGNKGKKSVTKLRRRRWSRRGKTINELGRVRVTTYEVCNIDKQVRNKFAWNVLNHWWGPIVSRMRHRHFQLPSRSFDDWYRLSPTGTPLQNNLHEL